jgi:hypothetical protein
LDQWALQIDAAPGIADSRPSPLRYSVFFWGPASTSGSNASPTCTGPDNPPQWPPITYAEWQTWWYDANYDPKMQREVA